MCDGLEEEDRVFLTAVASRTLLHNAAGFGRRISGPLRDWPFKILWLVYSDRYKVCQKRITVAKELLNTPMDELEINCRKVKCHFSQGLQAATATGKLECNRLYFLCLGISKLWKSDVRENERVNKMISLIQERCPSIGDDLKSSRVSLKYVLGSAVSGNDRVRQKWSRCKPIATAARETCLTGWDSMLEVSSDPKRWTASQAASGLMSSGDMNRLYMRLKPPLTTGTMRYAWAASYNMVLHRELPDENPLSACAFGITIRHIGATKSKVITFISADVIRNKHWVCPAEADLQKQLLTWHKPAAARSLLSVVQDQFDIVREGHTVAIIFLKLGPLGNSSTGSINEAHIGSFHKLVKLEKPSATFLAKIDKVIDNDKSSGAKHRKKHSGPGPNPGSEPEQTDPHPENRPEDPVTDKSSDSNDIGAGGNGSENDLQAEGLDLLVEQAEASGACFSSAEGEGGDECDAGMGGNYEDHDVGFITTSESYGWLLSAGLHDLQAKEMNAHEADEMMAKLSESSGEHVVSKLEKEQAFEAIASSSCNIDSESAQKYMEELMRTQDMDDVEAAIEVSKIIQTGLDIPGASSSSSSSGAPHGCLTT